MVDANLMETLDDFQMSRWLALFDGINIIAENADKVGEDWGDLYIKQPALEDYVEKTSVLIYRELTGKELR